MSLVRIAALTAGVLLLSSCFTTRNQRFVEIDEAAREGDFETAATRVDDERDELYSNRDQVLYYLDSGMLNFYNREYQRSIQQFHEAERLIEEYFTRSISQTAATFLLNDNAQDYSGEDFEDIYLNVFKAVGFLQQDDFESAFVEVRRINTKLNVLEDKYQGLAAQYSDTDEAAVDFEAGESRFYNSALARYLSLIMYRADGNYDSARIDWEEMQEAFSQQSNLYEFPLPLDDTVIQRPDGARLSVLAFTGEAPVKRAETLYVVTFDNRVEIVYAGEGDEGTLIPEGYGSFYYPGVEGGYRFKFQLPRMQLRGSEVTRIRVVVDGDPVGELDMLESMEQIALDTFQVREPLIFLKTVTRTIVKGIAAQKGKEQMQTAGAESGSLFGVAAGLIGSVATDVAVDASEQADLRVSRYFPAHAHVGEWDVPPGRSVVEIEYYGANGLIRVETLDSVDLRPGELNFVTSFHNN
ncbi:MAG: COG3014 family protein [Alkalispirochaeta sp.]